MALVLRGGEFIATEALSESTLAGLSDLARRRPLVINGLELHQQDLAKLAEEAHAKGQPVWPGLRSPTHFSLSKRLTLDHPQLKRGLHIDKLKCVGHRRTLQTW